MVEELGVLVCEGEKLGGADEGVRHWDKEQGQPMVGGGVIGEGDFCSWVNMISRLRPLRHEVKTAQGMYDVRD